MLESYHLPFPPVLCLPALASSLSLASGFLHLQLDVMLVSSPFSPPYPFFKPQSIHWQHLEASESSQLYPSERSIWVSWKKCFDVFLFYSKKYNSLRRGRNTCGKQFPVLFPNHSISFWFFSDHALLSCQFWGAPVRRTCQHPGEQLPPWGWLDGPKRSWLPGQGLHFQRTLPSGCVLRWGPRKDWPVQARSFSHFPKLSFQPHSPLRKVPPETGHGMRYHLPHLQPKKPGCPLC